jgi:hypothetical protein
MKLVRILLPMLVGLSLSSCSSSHSTDAGTPVATCSPACASGLTCLGGQCAPSSCSQASDCPSGFSCQAGFCTSGVCVPLCPDSQICLSGVCVNKDPCGPHEIICGSGSQAYCANLEADDANCGSCGQTCPSGDVCARGQCEASCLENETQCGNLCVVLQTDNQNCGTCGTTCGKGQLCSGGLCAATCTSPDATTCGTAQAQYCADIYISPFDCGGCGTTCGGTEYCSQGICQARCGGLASQLCDGICVDQQTDLENCGSCGHPCKSGQVCYGGECVATCGFPYVTCSAGQSSYCANLFEDALNCGSCGQTCPVGQVCSDGVCASACTSGTPCNGICANLETDNQNCGTCGSFCPGGELCNGLGQCSTVCALGFTSCGSGSAAYCASLATDPANCGGCGTLCAGGGACVNGSCPDGGVVVPDGGTTDGGATGGDGGGGPPGDAGPCGGCGAGLVCVGFTCQSQSCDLLPCLPGFACIDGGCLQPSCAQVSCPDQEACANGKCFPIACNGSNCDAGVCSNNTCVEISCAGITCSGSDVCSAGVCNPSCASGCSAPLVCVDNACQPGCTVDSAVYQAGEFNPNDLCQICEPSIDPGGWSSVAGGNACGGGNVCTGSGTCTTGCAIGGAGYPAGATNSADVCQICNPALSTNGWSAGTDNVVCGTGEICRGGACIAGCAIDGFVSPGTLDPLNPCQSCNPKDSVTGYSPLPDGTACQDADGNVICKGGLCTTSCTGNQTCPSANDVCQTSTGICTPGCLIGGTFYSPATADPSGGGVLTDGGPIPLCCAPNLSTGSWTPEWATEGYGAGAGLVTVSAADLGGFNGPGVITANYTAQTATVLYNNGNGTLSAPAAYNLGLQPYMAGVGDVTGDGIPDIVAMGPNDTGPVVVLPGQVGGTFGAPTTGITLGGSTMLGVAAHFFKSGAAALITTIWNGAGGPLQISGQGPDGGLEVLQSNLTTFFWGGPYPGQQLLIMDLNGDGLDDLAATTDYYTHFTAVLLNNAAGNLGNESDYLVGHSPQGLAAASIFGKHFPSGVPVPDLVTFDSSLQQVVVLQNNGNGNFVLAGSSPVLSATSVAGVAAGDFNGDGWGDAAILINSTNPFTVQILLGDGSGNLTPGPSFPTNNTNFQNAGMTMLGGPFGYNGSDGFFAMTDSSTITLWQDVCQ